ncbi:MAG TPA: PH domain-containing protein [Mycobacteriales bacterium]|nr:PH domain-containing protein [Mycobacteriales bacterium]
MGEVGIVVSARPVRLRAVCGVLAGVVLVVFAVIAVLLRRYNNGAAFGPADQVSMFGIGVAVAAGLLVLARPSLSADESGLRVRNIIGRHEVPWQVVRGVSFRDGAPWATLELADDEQLPLMAVQAVDGDRTVAVVEALRALHRGAGPG